MKSFRTCSVSNVINIDYNNYQKNESFFKNYHACNSNNNNNEYEDAPSKPPESTTQDKPSEEEYAISMMKKYPLGFNKTEKECVEESDEHKSEACIKIPKKKKKNAEKTNNIDEISPSCVYNVWVPDCLRSKKDFIDCQQINLDDIYSKVMFEKFFNANGYFSSSTDYDDFLECGKGKSTRLLQGVETKFKVEIDVSDSFYALTGSKLRAYSFQGSSRKNVYSAFSYFRSSWVQEMAINTVTNYDQLFQPDDWYYSIFQSDLIKSKKMEIQTNEIVNVSNNTFQNKYESEFHNLKDCNIEENCNQNRLSTSSEIHSIDNINNENKYSKMCKKNNHIFKLCFKYIKAPKNKLQKLLLTSIKSETKSISCNVSNIAKIANENNKNKESLSLVTNENHVLEGNYKFVNYLLDSHNKPIPIWLKF